MKNRNFINRTDMIHVTAIFGRNMIVTSNFSGADSLNDIYKRVLDSANGIKGVVTLRLRNSTQGWVQQHTLVLNPSQKTEKKNSTKKCSGDYPSLFGIDLI